MYTAVRYIFISRIFKCTVGYGMNQFSERNSLWKDICCIRDYMNNFWLIAEDFNNILNTEDRIGVEVRLTEVVDFREYFGYVNFSDIQFKECYFIWNNK